MYGTAWIKNGSMDVTEDTATPPPTGEASVQDNIISGYNFTPNGDVRVEVFDSGPNAQIGLASLQLLDEAIPIYSAVHRAQSNSSLWIGPGEHGLDLLPGMYIQLTDLTTNQETSIRLVALTVSDVDYALDLVSGTADPGAYVVVRAGDAFYSYEVNVTANANGNWVASFVTQGVDLTVNMWINAYIYDPNGGATFAGAPPPPQFWVSAADDRAGGWGWPILTPLQIDVYDTPGGSRIGGPYEVTTSEAGDFAFDFGAEGVDLQVGHHVIVTNPANGRNKATTVVALTYDYADYENDLVGGTANPGARVTVSLSGEGFYLSLDTFADAAGMWALDLAAQGFNISPDMQTTAMIFDEDRDGTQAWLPPPVVTVNLDIKPESFPNSINPNSKGTISVAILSAPNFNAPSRVDKASLTFGRTGDEQSLVVCKSVEDVNNDGLLDQICHFNTQLAGFQVGDTEGILRGQTVDGVSIEGRDSVRIVPPTKGTTN